MGQDRLSARQRDIIALIETEGAQYIEQLALRYDLTTQTIRRDINALCDLGFARRFHGGVDLPVQRRNLSVNARAALHSSAKQNIAAQVAAAIPPESTIFMGIGSTVQFVAKALRNHDKLRVVTNNIDVALTLSDAPQIEVHLTGGIMRHNDRDVVGPDTLDYFEKFYASHAIFGAGALDLEKGILDYSYSEAQLTQKLMSTARLTFLAADASKWGREASVRVARLDSVTHFFTDRLPSDAAGYLAETGVEIVMCGDAE
ncbi:MAG: DeoR/GlpR transcriptional regulator [Devosia sp.]|uniref:DeoR/GlpR family DNA-binding transcription regulator n=1 Tax=unclassified Devosia TaxID=196773 RepID=UPI0019F94F8D|nr:MULTISPECIES: DeoR/GlpR family DNA-binding transcription regulator [unclassified Devosia]MBF0678702.1 DeoR/GlpR transcriptional regulator [Devosia sp.]WEJ35252.1 DeoR/GlpR family DNA-binding transcription regulator [Devosia sp. SD17-2]